MEEKNLNLKIIPPQKYLPYIFAGVGALLVIFLAALAINSFKQFKYIGQSYEYRKTINVSGKGMVFAKPDIGQVDLSVLVESDTVAKAVAESNNKMNKINQAIKELGVKEEDLKTTAYNINPKYQYTAGKSVIVGYEVYQTLQIKIRDLDKSSQILEKAAGLGANQVGSLTFTMDDEEKLKDEARKKAIEDAKSKAKEIASSLGIRLGKVLGFSESLGSDAGQVYYGIGGAEGRGGGAPVPAIQTGQNEIIVNVDLMYEVK